MNKYTAVFVALGLLAANVLAQTNIPSAAPRSAGTTNDLNDKLVTQDGTPICERYSIGLVSDHVRPGSPPLNPWTARIVTSDGRDLEAFAFAEGEWKGALVGYIEEFTLMVREQDGKRLGKVFTPRFREKVKTVSEESADGTSTTKITYDGRAATDVEAYVFEAAGWVSQR